MLLLLTFGTFVATLALISSATYFFVFAPGWKKQRLVARLAALEDASAPSEEALGILRNEKVSDIAIVNDLLLAMPGISQLNLFLQQAAVRMQAGSFVMIVFVLALLGLLDALILNLPAPAKLLLFVAPPAVPFFVVSIKRRRRLDKFEEMFPDAMDLLARAVRSGHAFATGFELLGTEMPDPVAEEFRFTYHQHKLGLSLRDALQNLVIRVPLADVRIFVSALQIQQECGGNLGEILDTFSAVVRERFSLIGEVRTHTAEGRLTMYMLSAIPCAGGILLYLTKPTYMTPLLTDPGGQQALAAALVLQIIGYFVIRWIIRIKV
jgi:tight adherence protein B